MRGAVGDIFSELCDSEIKALSVLLNNNKPMKATDIAAESMIARTKIYTTLKSLKSQNLVNEILPEIIKPVVPEIWEYWSEKSKIKWANQQSDGTSLYQINATKISTELHDRMNKSMLNYKVITESISVKGMDMHPLPIIGG